MSKETDSQLSSPINSRQEIITLLRGQVACPLLSCLGELGWLERMLHGVFSLDDLSPSLNRTNSTAVLDYLTALGLITPLAGNDGRFETTELGHKVFMRYGAFCLLNSYEQYFNNFRALLTEDSFSPTVNRLVNVIGSGQLHTRKFFPTALSFLKGHTYDIAIDVGCGDGQFLEYALRDHIAPRVAAIDLSPVATQVTTQRLGRIFPSINVRSIVADGGDISLWSNKLALNPNEKVLVSLWFVLHEFSQGKAQTVISFFQTLYRQCPQAEILLGELVSVPAQTLAPNRSVSIMPEFLLFHALSGQGVLSSGDWQKIRASIPYTIENEQCFDAVANSNGENIPSSFIWHLKPCEK